MASARALLPMACGAQLSAIEGGSLSGAGHAI
jgi:hypothetical protein